MIKVYPSSATFSLGRENAAEWSSQCHRMLWLGAHDIRKPEDISEESRSTGAAFEDHVYRHLEAEFEAENIAKEKGLTLYDEISGWVANGRCDFVVSLADGSRMAIECKATRSSATAADHRARRIKPGQLGQLLIYMSVLQSNVGRLYTGVYNKKDEVTHFAFYEVRLDGDGTILVDGVPYQFNIQDMFNTFDIVAEHYETGTVPDRPLNHTSQWKSPCARCPFDSMCDQYETRGSTPAFVEECAKLSPKREY